MYYKRIFAGMLATALSFTVATAADDVVKIGVLTDLSGPLADQVGEGAVEATRLAVEEFGGTVLGKQIEVVSADHQHKPDLGSSIARSWIDVDDVDLILDLGSSGVAIGIQNIVKEKDKISIAIGATSSELTNKFCNTNSFAWGYDTYQFAKASTSELMKKGYDSFFFITVDYAFGHALEDDTKKVIEEGGGKVLGSVKHPINTMDFSSYLLQAQASGAKVIAFAGAGADLQNALKQGAEFGLFQDSIALPLAMLVTDLPSVGLDAVNGTILSSVAYWDATDETREFSERFRKRMGKPPSEGQAANYSATLHYLKAIEAANSIETDAVLAKMRELPVNDAFTKDGRIRADGRLMRDIHLVRIKSPDESKEAYDYFEIIGAINAEDAFRPVSESVCPLLKAQAD